MAPGSAVMRPIVMLAAFLFAARASAESLQQQLNGLFGGNQSGSGLAVNVVGGQPLPLPLGAEVSSAISGALTSARSSLPIASGSGGFSYEYDPDLDLFVRVEQDLGPLFSERVQTLGKRQLAVSASYSYAGFNTYNGQDISDFPVGDVAVGQQLVARPGNNLPGIADDQIDTSLDLGLSLNVLSLFATYGVTDALDVGIALPLVWIDMSTSAVASVSDPRGDSGAPFTLNRLQLIGDTVDPTNNQVARDGFDSSSFGPSDLYLRAKYRFLESRYVDAAGVLTVTLPTGGADDFRGFQDPTGTPLLVLSKNLPFFSPHVNLGYAIRSADDISQFVWSTGADLRLFPWLTGIVDFLGFNDTVRAGDLGPNQNVYQYSLGVKLNPWRDLIWAVNFQMPLNQDGLRADVIYTTQLQYTFTTPAVF